MNWLSRIQKTETLQGYLLSLGGYLLWRLPLSQVREILADCQDYFSVETAGEEPREKESMREDAPGFMEKRDVSRETTEFIREGTSGGIAAFKEKKEASGETAAFMEKWGTPLEAAGQLLEEYPGNGFHRRDLGTVIWGLLLAASFYGLFFAKSRMLLSLLLWSVSVLGFFHGRERTALEREFMEQRRLPGEIQTIHFLLPFLALFLEGGMQYLLWHIQVMDPATWLPVSVGTAVDGACGFFQLLCMLLFLWMFLKMAACSMGYFAPAVHACGAMLFVRGVRGCLHSMNLSTGYMGQDFLYALGYYGAGLALAVLFTVFYRAAGPARRKRG